MRRNWQVKTKLIEKIIESIIPKAFVMLEWGLYVFDVSVISSSTNLCVYYGKKSPKYELAKSEWMKEIKRASKFLKIITFRNTRFPVTN
jgi:hypothetical protein